MRLENRDLRFVVPFATFRPRRYVRLGGRLGSVQLQETALVAEGELLCFTFIAGIEWLFRRALSQWTAITVPYSRIEAVRLTSLWPLRWFSLIFAVVWLGVFAWAAWHDDERLLPFVVFGFAAVLALGYLNVRLRRAIQICYRMKDRRRVIAFTVKRKASRSAFIAALERHREAVAEMNSGIVSN